MRRGNLSRRLTTLAVIISSVTVMPLPAMAACDQDQLTFASGTTLKFSSQGVASSGTCNDVNMYYYRDGDGCNSESISHRGWYYDGSIDEWFAGALGFVTSSECNFDADNPLLTSVVTGTLYKFQSTQSGGIAIGLD